MVGLEKSGQELASFSVLATEEQRGLGKVLLSKTLFLIQTGEGVRGGAGSSDFKLGCLVQHIKEDILFRLQTPR